MGIKEFWYKNGSTVLTGAGVIGLFGTAYAVYKITPKWIKWKSEHPHAEKDEKIKAVTKLYLPAGIIAAGSTACIIGSHAHDKRVQASLAGALSVTVAGYKKYRDVVRDAIGDNAEEDLRKSITDEFINEADIPENLNPGMSLYFEPISEQWFEATREDIYHAEKVWNIEFQKNSWASINVFLSDLGLEPYIGSDLIGYDKDSLFWNQVINKDDGYYIQIEPRPAVDNMGNDYFIIEYLSGEPEPISGMYDPFI